MTRSLLTTLLSTLAGFVVILGILYLPERIKHAIGYTLFLTVAAFMVGMVLYGLVLCVMVVCGVDVR